MPNRKRRNKKAIASIEKSIEEHEEKREQALEDGDEGLARYYDKEIVGMKENKEKRNKIVNRKKK